VVRAVRGEHVLVQVLDEVVRRGRARVPIYIYT
jgi:hypothetical protein